MASCWGIPPGRGRCAPNHAAQSRSTFVGEGRSPSSASPFVRRSPRGTRMARGGTAKRTHAAARLRRFAGPRTATTARSCRCRRWRGAGTPSTGRATPPFLRCATAVAPGVGRAAHPADARRRRRSRSCARMRARRGRGRVGHRRRHQRRHARQPGVAPARRAARHPAPLQAGARRRRAPRMSSRRPTSISRGSTANSGSSRSSRSRTTSPRRTSGIRRKRHQGVVIGITAAGEHEPDLRRMRLGETLERLLERHDGVRVVAIGVDLRLRSEHRYTYVVGRRDRRADPGRVASSTSGSRRCATPPSTARART